MATATACFMATATAAAAADSSSAAVDVPARDVRAIVYTDYAYRRRDGRIHGERAFTLFLSHLAGSLGALTVIGRLAPESEGQARYALDERVRFVELPHYPSLARPVRALPAMARSLARFWRALDDVDAAWLLGPHPLALGFALLAALRRRRVVLGVRQDLPRYARERHRGRPALRLGALVLEAAFRTVALGATVVTVGPDLARRYRHARRTVPIAVSLVEASAVEPVDALGRRDYGDELVALSVGRLDAEKNPAMLADVLAELRRRDPRWRLMVCGEGPQRAALEERLGELGVEQWAELAGYVPIDRGLGSLYRSSHALIHVSLTEGVPQILFEAFAAALPVVATDVGGVRETCDGAGLLIGPGDPVAAAVALQRIGHDGHLREQLVERGRHIALQHTLESESERVAAALGG